MNIKLIAFAILAAVTLPVHSAEGEAAKAKKKHRTPEELAAMVEKSRLRRTGGEVRKAGTARGWFVLVDSQSALAMDDYKAAVTAIDEQVHVQTKIVKADNVNLMNPKPIILANDAKIGVVLADSAELPSLLTAPEAGWAIVNVRALAAADKQKTALRTRREIMRAFALVGGCSFMARAAILLRDIEKPEELDGFIADDYGIDVLATLERTLPQRGLTPWHQTTYKVACQEGWASDPTNDIQKAIWDKVHNPPEKPMKITYDKDKQKPVVK